jgi:hypothetical protein
MRDLAINISMLSKTDYSISTIILQEALDSLPNIDSRLSLNQPTGNFFTDPWEVRSEFADTVWKVVLGMIPNPIGEARLIKLKPKECYSSHADIDDRWHLNLTGNNSYLIDLETNTMHQSSIKQWYSMNAGIRHVAANFGSEDRIQLVVRRLLPVNQLVDPVTVAIKPSKSDSRFHFDDVVSPWLNKAFKVGIVANFGWQDTQAEFDVERNNVEELRNLINHEHHGLEISIQN